MDHQRYLKSALPFVKRLLPSLRLWTLLSVAFFVGFMAVSLVFADDALPKPAIAGLPFATKTASQTIAAINKQVILYTGVIAIIAISWGWMLFITAFGEEEKLKKGKKIVQYTIIGVLISISAYFIVDLVNKLTV